MKTYKYTTSVTIGKDLNGKPIKKYIRADTKHELDRKKAELLAESGLNVDSNMTFNELTKIWFNLRIKHKSASYQRNTKQLIANNIEPVIGFMLVQNIKKINVELVINRLVEIGKHNTAQKVLMIIKSILELAVENDIVGKNVAHSIKPPKYIKQEKLSLTKEQQQAIINSTSKYADFYTFLLFTGLRRGEVAALMWKDIDLNKRTITVDKACDFSTNKPTIKATKNGKARTIPIFDKIRPILERRANEKHSNYVFEKNSGGILTEIALKRMLQTFCKEVGFTFTLHQLRHTFCTMLYYSGISSKKAQQLMRSFLVRCYVKNLHSFR